MQGPNVDVLNFVPLPFTVDTTSNVERAPLPGMEAAYRHETYGYQVYRLIRNTSGGTLDAYRVVQFASGSSLNVDAYATAAQVQGKVAGILQSDLANGSYGWVLKRGDGLATTASAVVIDTQLKVDDGAGVGKLDDDAVATDSREFLAWALQADTAGGADIRVRVAIR